MEPMSNIYYTESTPLANAATGSAATVTATLTSATGRTAYINGFTVSGLGATASGNAAVTVSNVLGGTQTYNTTIPAGATVAAPTLQINFPMPIPATGSNTNITVAAGTFGAGNTQANVFAYGYLK